MIINFSVKNFKCIKDTINLSFEASKSDFLEDYYVVEPKKGLRLLKLALIYGANASGKTTILEAIDFLRNLVLNPLEKKTDRLNLSPFVFEENQQYKNTSFTLEFFHDEIKYLYNLSVNRKFINKEKLFFFNPNKALVFERETDPDNLVTNIKFGSKISIGKERKDSLLGNTLSNNTVLGGYLKTNFQSSILTSVLDWFGKQLKPIVFSHTPLVPFISDQFNKGLINKNIFVEILRKADFGINDINFQKKEIKATKDFIEFLVNKTNITESELEKIKEEEKYESVEILIGHLLNNKKYFLHLDEESAGTQRYYELSGLLGLMMKEKSIILLDELESSLHPELIKHFLLTFLVNSKQSQLITTTHHRELLMEKDMLRNDVIWFTEKKPDLSTDLFSLRDFKTSVIRKQSSIYNAYRAGKFGATPSLHDYYID